MLAPCEAEQTNESYYLLIKNSRNPEGKPIDPMCGGVYVVLDSVPVPAHIGTFYLMAGEGNLIEMHHYCDLWSQGLCTEYYDPAGEGGGGCGNCESVSLVLSTIAFDRNIHICEPGSQPITDRDWCDGFDNDCDGVLDEDETCDLCKPIGVEVCNGLDDDCDGVVDNVDAELCGAGLACVHGDCRQECRSLCDKPGESCQDGTCLPAPCGAPDHFCAAGQSCTVDGTCADDCGVCPDGTLCEAGSCVDPSCHTNGCSQGLVCIEGECTLNVCDFITCASTEYCRLGECVGSCAEVSCASDELCVDGVCLPDLCEAVSCDAGQKCAAGDCVQDPCAGIVCPGALICVDGSCVGDPCEVIECPDAMVCTGAQCLTEDQAADQGIGADGQPLDQPSEGGARIDGGCSCQQSRPSAIPPLALLLGGGVMSMLSAGFLRKRRPS